jgi:hypothetical protein
VVIRKCVVLLAPVLALAVLLTVGGAGPVLADARPSIVSITLDADNHAVVTWAKEPWQASLDVWWSSGDGTVAAPDANWNGHYGWPLVDCWGGQQNGQPTGRGPNTTWLYGGHCQGQDVADEAETTTTNVALAPGTYFFQVIVAGENADTGAKCSYQDKGLPTECLSPHYSDTYRLTVSPLGGGTGTAAPGTVQPLPEPTLCLGQAGPTCPPGANPSLPQEIDGPGGIDLPQDGHVDVASGAQATFNPPFNLDVEFGEIHFSEDLAIFHCPAWTEPYPPEATLGSWIGIRCRTVTTPEAGALVEGTDFDATVSATTTTFYVFSGKIEVSDLGHEGVVSVGPGQMTIVRDGQTPSAPVSFDTSSASLRWWDTGPTDAQIAAIVFVSVSLFFLVYFLPAIVVLVRRPEHWRLVGLIDLLTAWTVIGWIVALVFAFALPGPGSTASGPPPLSPDGGWWWDGQVWRPMPLQPRAAGAHPTAPWPTRR